MEIVGIAAGVATGVAAAAWLVVGVKLALGLPKIPWLRDVKPLGDAECPKISVLFSARDEAKELPRAIETLLKLDYPNYEIVAVDDRSVDGTGEILDEAARLAGGERLKVVHVKALPDGWLGKSHGLQKAYEAASGEWLVFTDADVRFAPDLLRRTTALARERGWDHLTLLGEVETRGFWERVVTTYFTLGFMIYCEPWNASNPKSKKFCGVGLFQQIRREVYEAIGGHRRLRMEVVDDMKLGKMVKGGGYRSGVAVAEKMVMVRWQDGFGNIVKGVTKNFFAAADFKLWKVMGQVALVFLISVLPVAGVVLLEGWWRWLALAACAGPVVIQGASAWKSRVSPLYGLTHAMGAVIFAYMILRSTAVTLWRGGVVWRDTYYSMEELKKGIV